MALCQVLIGYMKKIVDENSDINMIDKSGYRITGELRKKLLLYFWHLYVESKGGVSYILTEKNKRFLEDGKIIADSQVKGYRTCSDKAAAVTSGVSFID